MAFQTIGVKMIVQGASQFARDISRAATATYDFGKSVSRVATQQLQAAAAADNLAQRAYKNLYNEIIRLTSAQSRMAQSIASQQASLAKYDALLNGSKQALAGLRTGSLEWIALNQVIMQAERNRGLMVAALARNQNTLAQTTQTLVQKTGMLAAAQASAAAARQKLNDTLGSQTGLLETLGKAFGILLGSMDKDVTGATGLARSLGILSLRFDALNFILQGAGAALSTIGIAFKVVIGIVGTVIGVFAKLVSVAFNVGKALLSGVFDALKKIVSVPVNIIVGAFNALWQSLKRIGEIAIGMNLSNLIWNLGTKVKEVGEMALEASGNFQLLRTRMTALIQREQLDTSGTKFADSLQYASQRASELNDWISQLAVKSIFSADAIANVFTLGMSYDMTSKDAQELTGAIVNFATGMGLQEDQMRRIIENFGQMKAQGKLTGTEMRDLARGAFVPVNRLLEIFGTSLGMDTSKLAKFKKELQDDVSEGKTDIKGFFDAFVKMSNQDFPDSVNKMSKSWSVVKSNIKDFITSVIGWRVITPTLDLVSSRMSDFISKFMTPETLDMAKNIGNAIGFLADKILKLFDAFTPEIINNISSVANSFNLIYRAAKTLADGYKNQTGDIKGYNKAIGDLKTGMSHFLQSAFGMNLTKALNLSDKLMKPVNDLIYNLVNPDKVPITESFTKIFNNIKEIWKIMWDNVFGPQVRKSWEKFKEWITGIWNSKVVPIFQGLWKKITDSLNKFWTEDLPTWWNTVAAPTLVDLINGLADAVSGTSVGESTGKKVTSGILGWLQSNAGPGSAFASNIASIISSVFTIALAAGINILNGGNSAVEEQRGSNGPTTSLPQGASIVAQQKEQDNVGRQNAMQAAIDNLAKSARKALDDALLPFNQWAKDAIEPFDKFAKAVEALWKIIDKLVTPMVDIAEAIGRIVVAVAGIAGGGQGGGGGGGFTSFVTSMINLASANLTNTANSLTNIAMAIEGISKLPPDTLNIIKAINGGPAGIVDFALGKVFEALGGIVAEAVKTAGQIVTIFQTLACQLVNCSLIPDMFALMTQIFQSSLLGILGFVQVSFIDPMVAMFSFDPWFNMAVVAMDGFLQGLIKASGAVLDWFDTFKSNFVIDISFNWRFPADPGGGGGGGGGGGSGSTTPKTPKTPQTPSGKTGTGVPLKKGGHFMVPPGFNENYVLRVSSGEEVIVIPRSSALKSAGPKAPSAPSTFNTVNNAGSSFSSSKSVNNYLTVNTQQSSNNIVRDFRSMKFLGE